MHLFMSRLRHSIPISQYLVSQTGLRKFQTTSINRLKEIKISHKDAQTTVIEGVKVTSPRAGNIVGSQSQSPLPSQTSGCQACPLCRLNLRHLDYTDVLILSQFIESNGKLMDQKDTSLCFRKYGLVKHLVRQAQKCHLLPRPSDYEVFGPWDSLNTYIDNQKRNRDQPMQVIKQEYWR